MRNQLIILLGTSIVVCRRQTLNYIPNDGWVTRAVRGQLREITKTAVKV